MEYQLELKQIVDFPRCRIYRNFIQTLLNDRSIRTTGGSFLFWYLIFAPTPITAIQTGAWSSSLIRSHLENGSAASQNCRIGFAAGFSIRPYPS